MIRETKSIQLSDEVRRAYDRWACTYDTVENPTRDMAADMLRHALADAIGGQVLELGCGTGLNSRWLARNANTLLALDLSPVMLSRARESGVGEANFAIADISRSWPFSAYFDWVVETLVLEHVGDLGHVFREASRVLRPGGKMFLVEYHPFRQMLGSQARFCDPETASEIKVPAYLHDFSDYCNHALDAGFMLRQVGERRDPDDRRYRLLSLLLEKSPL